MPSADFSSLLGECQDAIQSATFSGWEPPGSKQGIPYEAQLVDVKSGGKRDDNGVANVWVRPTFKITQGEYKGREFGCFYSTKAAFALGDFFQLVTLVTRNSAIEATRNLSMAVTELEAMKGRPVLSLFHKVETYLKRDKVTEGKSDRYVFDRLVDLLTA